MAEEHTATIGPDGARPAVIRIERAGEAGPVVRTVIECSDAPGSPAETSDVAAAVSAAVRHAFSSGAATENPGGRIRRTAAWAIAGRLDAVGLEGMQRIRIGVRSRTMQTFHVRIDGRMYEVNVEEVRKAPPPLRRTPMFQEGTTVSASHARRAEARSVRAPIPGKILAVNVGQSEPVNTRTVLLVLEAMKMENEVLAPMEGTVKSVHVRPGDTVNAGDVMVVIE